MVRDRARWRCLVSDRSTESRRVEGNKKPLQMVICKGFYFLAEWTGLEPATPGVTGRYSNQLNYRSKNLASPRGFEPRYPP